MPQHLTTKISDHTNRMVDFFTVKPVTEFVDLKKALCVPTKDSTAETLVFVINALMEG